MNVNSMGLSRTVYCTHVDKHKIQYSTATYVLVIESGDSTRTLLGLYEYEAQLRLHRYDALQAILDHVSSQPNVELKTLETMAGMWCPYYKLCCLLCV